MSQGVGERCHRGESSSSSYAGRYYGPEYMRGDVRDQDMGKKSVAPRKGSSAVSTVAVSRGGFGSSAAGFFGGGG